MNRKQSDIIGNTQINQEITRIEAASQLQPPVSTRTVQKYLEVASLFLPSFAQFLNRETGYLNRYAKLSTWHVPALQRIRSYVRHKGFQQLQVALSTNPEYFETGAITADDNIAAMQL